MGTQQSKGNQKAPRGKAANGLPGNLPELFRFMNCDITPENEGHAEIESWSTAGHVVGMSPHHIDQRRQQPSTPMRAEGAHMQGSSPTREQAGRSPAPEAARGPYKARDRIEIWSKSQQAWCSGRVDKLEGSWVHISYRYGPDGQPMTKIMPNGHEDIRAPGGPRGSPPQKLHNQSPMPAEAPISHPAPSAAPMDGASPGALFNLPGLTPLSMPDNMFANNNTSVHSSPAPPADAFANLAGGMDLWGSMRMQMQQKQQPTTPQPMQVGSSQPQHASGLTPSQCTSPTQPWQCQSPTQPQSTPGAVTPGALGTPGSAQKKYQEPEVHGRVPLNANVERIEPEEVQRLLQSNQCVLVDLRGEDRSVGIIPGSIHVQAIDSIPFMQKIPGLLQRFQNQSFIVFTCQYSAHRAPQCANWYKEHAEQSNPRQRVAIMTGGFRAWEGNGLPFEGAGIVGGSDKYAADAFALLQGVQFTQKTQGVSKNGPFQF